MFRKILSIRVCFLLLALGLALAGSCSHPDEPFRFEVLMEDTGGLRVGASVRAGDEVLGRVVGIQRGEEGTILTLELDSKYRGRLSRKANFSIVTAPRGDDLVLSEAFGSPAIEDGSQIDARPDWLEKLSRGLQDWKQKTGELLRSAGSSLQEFTQELRQSPEAQALADSIEEFGRDLATVTRDRYQSFVDKKLPELEARARKHRDELIAEGREREAEIFWKWFERWANAMRGEAQSGPAEAEENRPPG